MTRLGRERDLIDAALALAGDAELTAAERKLARSTREPGPVVLKGLRTSIEGGADPLGEALIRLRSPALRRETGTVYTPPAIIDSMLAWAQEEATPVRVIDPGAGSGRFLIAAGRRFPRARLVGIEVDPLAALILRANLAVLGLAERAEVIVGDYREARIMPATGKTFFVGNPPYVRHHAIGEAWKAWYASSAAAFGIRASTLAGLHLHFFVRTLQLAQKGDFGAFITAAEWLDVNYGDTLRRLLGTRLGGVALHVLEPAAMPFADTLTTGAITCFRVDGRPRTMRVRSVPDIAALNGLSTGEPVPWKELRKARRWSVIVRPTPPPPAGYIELGELCRVRRGQVTGGNSVWIAGEHAKALPARFLKPTVTKARELISAGDALTAADELKRVVDLPVDLDELDAPDRRAVDRFLRWAKAQGGADSYIAQHRRAWWSVLLYEPPPIMCTYMARRPPAFVRNLCGAHHINIAHGLYPRAPLGEATLRNLIAYLRGNISVAAGRTYAGGLTKFEPGELERIPVPAVEMLRDATTTSMDGRPANNGRRDGKGQLSG
jgi:hypothetical protein